MADTDGELTVAQRLGRALDRGLLPAGGPAEAAERLIERLERPARLALLGLPGSGKSSILNLLVGAVVVPETLRLPTIVVQHGNVSRMICTLTDGTTKILPGADLAEVLPLAPALVTLEMDLPALRVISLLEVSAGPMEAEQRRAATWASKRADIVIWCTTSYLPKEQAVWESLPDSVKDNSFMFLTKVDLLGGREPAQAMHDRVELRAGEEFRQILSISARQARAAAPPGGQVNRELFRDSGAGAVITAIKTRVQSGRRADMDTAELLLARHVEASELVAKRFAESDVTAAAQPWTPPPEAEVPSPVMPDLPKAELAAASEPPPSAVQPEPVFPEEPEPEPAPELEVDDLRAVVSAPADHDTPVATEPWSATDLDPDAEADSGLRRRFADRIKKVASDSEPTASPMVPLRSTWKSKAELAAQAAVEAEPPVREIGRRPRATAQTETAEMASAAVSPPSVAVPPETAASKEPTTPAVTAPAAEAPRMARPQLFGARRAAERGGTGSPLPDLSVLRATPEEMEAALQAEEGAPEPDEEEKAQRLPGEDTGVAEPEETARPMDRPRMFSREPRVPPAEPMSAPPADAAIPVPAERRVRSTPRVVASAAALHPPSEGKSEESPFSPRSIMQRAPVGTPDAPSPRRERPRIAPRAIPAAPAPATAAPIAGLELGLVSEAIDLIAVRSADLEREIDPEGKVPVDLILDHARETGERVMAVVSRGRSEELRRINSDLGEVMDLIMLMQLEKGHAPADDALTLILQLKRELETLSSL